MKKFALFLLAFAFTSLQAQVGINTTDPKAQLEIKATNQATPDATDGILIPKVDTFPAINPTSDQDGMMVYLTTDIGANLKGFYYWDNTNAIWKSISGDKGWGLAGNAGTDVTTNFIGTTDNQDLVFKRNNVKSGLVSYNNTSFGNNTLSTDTLVFGFYAGKGNTAFGGYTLASNTTGDGNAAFGESALPANTTGSSNTAVGKSAMVSNISGSGNSAFGYGSLLTNISGLNNTGLGYRTLWNTISNNNTAIGSTSMYENTSGSDNVAIGTSSLANNKTGNVNVAIGTGALKNNIESGNVAIGKDALLNNFSGNNNSAVGTFSMYSNTTGIENCSFGNLGLYLNSTGDRNCAFGSRALMNNTSGSYNVSSGYRSMNYNTTGSENCAYGDVSLSQNTAGNNNSAFGGSSLFNNIVGNNNASFGNNSLKYNTSGSANNAFGRNSLINNTNGTGNGGYGEAANPTTSTGWNNIGIGFHTLGQIDVSLGRIYGNQIGYDNIAFGLVAGDRIGNNCNQSVFIGPFTNVITNDTNVSNATAIGNGALVFQNNMMRLGNSAVTRIETQVGLTVVSDGRYKFNVKEEVKGLDFIKKLRPVVYQYDTEKMDREWMNTEFDTMAKHNPQILKDYKKASQIRYSGFIAQEVETAAKAINYEFSGISKPENDEGHYGLDYASFVVPLVKSIQEQQKEIEDLEKQLASEKSKNIQIEKRLKAIEQKLSNL